MALIKAVIRKAGARVQPTVIKTVSKGSSKGKRSGSSWSPRWNSGGKGAPAGGQWLFIPDSFGSKGKGKGSKGKGKVQWNRTMDKLNKIAADKKVWIGGLTRSVTWKKLEKHMEEVCGSKPKVTETMSKGTGCCAFASEDEAAAAIAAANGSELEGKTIEVDVWNEKEKKEGEERPKRKFGATFQKGRGKRSDAVNLNSVDASLKVWVGGLAAKTNAIKLKKHFEEGGCEADNAKIMKPGTACVTFATEGDAAAAIGAMSGSELDGKTIEVDVWTKSEKKDKKVKEEP